VAGLWESSWLGQQVPTQLQQQQLVHPAAAALRWGMMLCQVAHLGAADELLLWLLQRGLQRGLQACQTVMQRMLKMLLNMMMMMCCL
jgi:hypothetical protein